MIEHMNTIDVLSDQIEALLDLMQMSEDSVDHKSIKIASEMCMTMHLELRRQVQEIYKEYMGDDEGK